MRKLLLLFTLFISFTISAQEKQSIVKLKNGTALKGVIKSIDPTDAVVISIAGVETNLKFDTISSIEEIDSNIAPIPEETVEKVIVKAEDPFKDFKGFLMAKGNNVYVYYSNTDGNNNSNYDKEGAKVLRSLLKSDYFWNVVDDMNQAHFTINYCVDTSGIDKAVLSISSWRTGKSHLLGIRKSDESVIKNNVIAFDFYEKYIRSLQQKIEKGKLSKQIIKDFTIK